MDTHVTFVLDSSGSMSSIEDDTRGGFNTFLTEQKNEEGKATVTLFDFNTSVECVYRGRALETAPELSHENYTPGGRTALHDAISVAITDTVDMLSEINADERADNVIVVVLTDGKENASETSQERVRMQVEKRREEFGWEFLFIGANQDAALTASKMGMEQNKSLDMAHSGEGAQAAYESTSDRVSEVRRTGETSGYDDHDRQRQEDADGS